MNTALFALASILLAIFSVCAESRAQNLFTLAQFLQSEDVRAARKRVLDANDTNALPPTWLDDRNGQTDDALLNAASLAASSYDLTGRVVELGYVDHEPFLDDWGPSIKKVWEALEGYVEQRRIQHKDSRYLDNFERLNESVGWWDDSRASPRWRRRVSYRHRVRRHERLARTRRPGEGQPEKAEPDS